MPILYVNPSGRRKKRFSFGKKLRRNASKRKSKRKGRMPKALAAYWAKKRGKKTSRRRRARKALATKKVRKAKRSKKMARKKKSRSRRRGRKRSKKSYARAARMGHRRRRKHGTKKRRTRSRSRKRKSSRSRRRGRKRGRKSRARAARLGWSRKRKKLGPVYRKSQAGRGGTVRGHGPITFVKANPSRRRRRKSSRRRRRRGRRTAARLGHRRRRRAVAKRYRKRKYRPFGRYRGRRVYVRNPGKMLIDLAKRAVPIVLATVGAKAITSKLGPKIPMLDRLGMFQGPVLSVLAIVGANYATKKVSFLAKHRDSILMGFAISAIHETISAIAPASVKGLLGMGDTYTQALADYVATNDYEQVAGMSDYVAVGGMEQELGMEQEMGFTQEMGDDLGRFGQGGLGGGAKFLAPVPDRKFLAPVPTHSFTGPVPAVTDEYDNASMLYSGIFGGGKL